MADIKYIGKKSFIDQVKEKATKEFTDAELDAAVRKYKTKLQEVKAARKVVANLERELEDLEDELSQDK